MRTVMLFLVGTTLVACGPDDRNMGTVDAPATGGDSADAPPVADQSRVYAHSGTRLYRVDTTTLTANDIGDMTGIGTQSITDIAIDKGDHMVGITFDKVYTIDPTTGATSNMHVLDAAAHNLTSLSYVPNPTLGGEDILVSADSAGEVFQIDPVAGTAVSIGNYGMSGADQIRSSGDLIGVVNLGIYATVDVGNTPGPDYLAKIDPTTWKATLAPNPTGFDKIFGLGFWAGKFYGFVDEGAAAGTGKIIEIDPVTGVGHAVFAGAIRWFGAGVATDAPIIQ
ncbi:MAG: hypothetical protein NT062_15265 [Proteobacteria bacterium]|nr:hypothetical protein [Pseudomonadota bacterium]